MPGATGVQRQFRPDRGRGLAAGKIDGFWANGMATEIAVTSGTGTIVLDVRRGDGPPGCFDYTMPVLATTERLIESSPETAAAALRALVAAQNALKQDVSLAPKSARSAFRRAKRSLSPGSSPRSAVLRCRDQRGFSRRDQRFRAGHEHARGRRALCRIVATQFRHLWS